MTKTRAMMMRIWTIFRCFACVAMLRASIMSDSAKQIRSHRSHRSHRWFCWTHPKQGTKQHRNGTLRHRCQQCFQEQIHSAMNTALQ